MAKPTATAAPDPSETEEVKPKAKPEAKPNIELVKIWERYDETVEKAETFFVQLVEFISDNELDRETVVASMMKARSCSFENAQSQYSRMKKLFNNPEVLQELKDGKITLKVARERTTTKQANPKSAKPEAKEAKFTNTLKAFVSAAKESGFSRAEILVTVTAELKAADVK